MLKLIKNLLERNSVIIAILLTIVITYLSIGRPINFQNPLKITFLDKIFHASAYFGLTLSWLFVFRKGLKKKSYIIIIIFLFGVLMEFLQGWLTENRQKDIYDVYANSFGILLGLLLFTQLLKYFDAIES